ncbi:hypothetical protein [Streptomyces sp. NPDC056296]|uniref:hypothetical protein n=1 Tax=Streptomyces sp. NPDC056296 TaxID=3345775 RepID=UPI0035DE079F
MADGSLWVAALTAGTAIAASWVTSRGSLRAAREQANATAVAQRSSWIAQARRESCIEVVNRAHDMGALYREVPVVLDMPAGAEKASAVTAHAKRLREAYGPFTRACDVLVVDAGHAVAEAVQQVFHSSRSVYMCLLSAPTDPRARAVYDIAIHKYWLALHELVWEMHREADRP